MGVLREFLDAFVSAPQQFRRSGGQERSTRRTGAHTSRNQGSLKPQLLGFLQSVLRAHAQLE